MIRVDSQGNAYVSRPGSSDFPITESAFERTLAMLPWGVGRDIDFRFLTRLNPQGTGLIYSTYFDDAGAFDIDALGNAYITGRAGRGFPVTRSALQSCMAGGRFDAGVAAQVLYAGAAATLFSGVVQFNVHIPENLRPSSSPNIFVEITIGGAASTDPLLGTTISVE